MLSFLLPSIIFMAGTAAAEMDVLLMFPLPVYAQNLTIALATFAVMCLSLDGGFQAAELRHG